MANKIQGIDYETALANLRASSWNCVAIYLKKTNY